MEFAGEPRASGARGLLGVPGLSSVDGDNDKCDVVIGIRPKCSPLPRRKASISEEEDSEQPPSGSRRVSFADAKGLSLVLVKEFDAWDVPKVPGYAPLEGAGQDAEEYYLTSLFSLPSSEELSMRVMEQKVELESIDLLPGTTMLRGVIRVVNNSFDKMVYVRTTLDGWASHFDLLAEYIPGSSDGVTDSFLFKLTLVPPFQEQGARVDFCLRYETPARIFWDNNGNKNYVLFCHQRAKELKRTPQREHILKKSCLKAISQNATAAETVSSVENMKSLEIGLKGVSKHGDEANMKSKQASNSQLGISEEDRQKLLVESSQNCSRKSQRRAARMARVKDYFAQKDIKPEDKVSEVSLIDPSKAAGGLPPCNKTSPAVQHYTPPAQNNGAYKTSEMSDNVNFVDPDQVETKGKDSTPTHNISSLSNGEQVLGKGKDVKKSVRKTAGTRQIQNNNHGIHHEPSDVSSPENKGHLTTEANGFTFGTVVAPLYPLVYGHVEIEGQRPSDQGAPVTGHLQVGDSSNPEHPPSSEKKENSTTMSLGGTRFHSAEIPRDLISMQESDRECVCITVNNPHRENERSRTSSSADTSRSQGENLADPQESGLQWTERPNNGRPFPEEDGTHQALNNDVLKVSIPQESPNLRGETRDCALPLDRQCDLNPVREQGKAETAHAHTAGCEASPIKTRADATLSQTQTLAETTCAQPPPPLPPRVSNTASVCANADEDPRTVGCASANCVRVDESHKHGKDIRPTIPVRKNGRRSHQHKQINRLQAFQLNQKTTLTITDPNNTNSVCGVKTVEYKPGSTAVDLSHTALSASPEAVEEPRKGEGDGGVEHGRGDDDDDEKRAVQTEDAAEEAGSISPIAGRKSHAHLDVSVKADEDTTSLAGKPTGASPEEERREITGAVTARASVRPELCAEGANWEMMVEEGDVLGHKGGGQKEEVTEEGERRAAALIEEKEETVEDIAALEEDEQQDGGVLMKEEQDVMMEKGSEQNSVAGDDAQDLEKNFEVEKDLGVTKNNNKTEEETATEPVVWEEEANMGKELEDDEDAGGATAVQEDGAQEAENRDEGAAGGAQEMEREECEEETETCGEREENMEEEEEAGGISDYGEEMATIKAGEAEIAVEAVKAEESGGDTPKEDRDGETEGSEQRSRGRQSKVEASAPVNNVHEGDGEGVMDRENALEGENACGPNGIPLFSEGGDEQNMEAVNEQSKVIPHSGRNGNDPGAGEAGSFTFRDEPERDPAGEDSSSTGSPSDDEVELHMRCLRVAQRRSLAPAARDSGVGIGLNTGKRPFVVRGKQSLLSMPSISESVDEEQPPGAKGSGEGTEEKEEEEEELHPETTPGPPPAERGHVNRDTAWWRETFSLSDISKTLLILTVLVVFLAVAYHYDFLACFLLYLMSVLWLCCGRDKQPVPSNNRLV